MAPNAAALLPAGFEQRTLVSGLATVTAVDWAPDGRMFLGHGNGRVMVVNPGSSTPITVLEVAGAVYDVEVDRNFTSTGYLYLIRTKGDTQRVSRVTIRPDNTVVNPTNPETVIIGKSTATTCSAPANTVDCVSNLGAHDLGTVISDPTDGTLWVGNGDNSTGSATTAAFRAYNEQSYAGKILHVDRDGNGLPGHPFCPLDTALTHVCTKVYASGLRNPFRFTLLPDGRPLIGDVGWATREEIDIGRPGGNFGWPCYEGAIQTPGLGADARCTPLYSKEGTPDAAVPPVYDYGHGGGGSVIGGPPISAAATPPSSTATSSSPTTCTATSSASSSTRATRSWRSRASAAGWAGSLTSSLRLTAISCTSTNVAGVVRQIAYPAALLNRTPVAQASANPTYGPVPLDVKFMGGGSSDPDGDTLSYDWDFGDGSPHSTAANPTHTYTDGSRNFTALLTVRDGRGGVDSESLAISPGNTPPQVSITAPATYRAGQTVPLHGSGADAQDGTLPESALDWTIKLIHVAHEHEAPDPEGVAERASRRRPTTTRTPTTR